MKKKLVNYAFIDGQNFYKSVEAIERELEPLEVQLDLAEFRIYLAEKHAVKTAFYFIGYIPGYKVLYDRLTAQGYELVYKEVAIHDDGVKGNVDVNLTMESLIRMPEYQKAILVASDGDYACLVEYLQRQGKLDDIIVCSRGGSSYLLRKLHSKIRILYLDDIMRDLYARRETS